MPSDVGTVFAGLKKEVAVLTGYWAVILLGDGSPVDRPVNKKAAVDRTAAFACLRGN